jgi:predicted  nucleic acid-binding Zn-ribbon protein
MGFLDKLKKQIDGAAETLSSAAAQQSEMFRINRQIAELKEEIDRQTMTAGRRALDLYAAAQLSDKAIADAARRVSEAEATISELTRQAERVRATPTAPSPVEQQRRCPKCSTLALAADRFCSGCGTELEAPQANVPAPPPAEGAPPSSA